MRRPAICWSLLLLAGPVLAGPVLTSPAAMAAETAANAACLSTQPTEVQQALLAYAGGALDAVPMTQVLPAGGQAQVLLNHTVKEDRRVEYRVLVQRGTLDTPAAADLKLLPASAVAAMTIGPTDPRHARLPASGNVTLLSFGRTTSFDHHDLHVGGQGASE